MVVETRKNFKFSGKKTWFRGNNKSMLYFRYRIFHDLISATKL